MTDNSLWTAQFYLRDKASFQFETAFPEMGRLKPPLKNFFQVSEIATKNEHLLYTVRLSLIQTALCSLRLTNFMVGLFSVNVNHFRGIS